MLHVGVRMWPLLLYVVCHTLRSAPTQITELECARVYTLVAIDRLLYISLAIHVRISAHDKTPHLVCGGGRNNCFQFRSKPRAKTFTFKSHL